MTPRTLMIRLAFACATVWTALAGTMVLTDTGFLADLLRVRRLESRFADGLGVPVDVRETAMFFSCSGSARVLEIPLDERASNASRRDDPPPDADDATQVLARDERDARRYDVLCIVPRPGEAGGRTDSSLDCARVDPNAARWVWSTTRDSSSGRRSRCAIDR